MFSVDFFISSFLKEITFRVCVCFFVCVSFCVCSHATASVRRSEDALEESVLFSHVGPGY